MIVAAHCWRPGTIRSMRRLRIILLQHVAVIAAASRAPAATESTRRDSMRRDSSFLRSAAAGGVAGASATVAFHPVDTAKTVLQRSTQGGGGPALRSLGVGGFYRGVLPAAFSMMPACAVRMGVYETFKKNLLQRAPEDVPPGALIFCASALSVVVSCAVRSPLDMIKTQVQANNLGSAAAIRNAWGNGGWAAAGRFYRGAGLALMRDVPFFSINLLLYEQLKAAALARASAAALAAGVEPPTGLAPTELVMIGLVAQGTAGLLTNPVDVLKTRVQAGGAVSVSAALQALLREGGPLGLMRGAGRKIRTYSLTHLLDCPVRLASCEAQVGLVW